MAGSVPRKHKASSRLQNDLATIMFKRGTFTSQWTEDDAINYFNMRKGVRSVLRTGQKDTIPVEWFLNEENILQKKELSA